MFGIRGIRLKVGLSNYYVLKNNNNKICPRNSTIINNELLSWIYYMELRLKNLHC